ncbi:integrase [Marisediminicola sp. UYEF4]|uniref:tyrosine-type recombinase/integrase n=1 Tax=Marisediminicola sp. UYEF4 TaxID=1756384 RepID=UPI003393AC6C
MTIHTTPAAAWTPALADFHAAQVATGLATATASNQVTRLQRLAQAHGGSPWDVTTEQLQAWLDALPCTAITVKGYRMTIRAFYRWAWQVGHVAVSPAPDAPPVTRYRLDQRWQDALALFETAERAAGRTPETIAQRVKHMTRLASEAPHSPWQMNHENLCDWLNGLPCSRPTQLQHRVSVRAFYRWAKLTGRVFEDPAVEPSGRAQTLPVPPAWEVEIRGYRSYLRANGHSETTTSGRMQQLGRFARDNASLSPFEVTLDDLIEWMSGKRWAAETRRGNRATLVSFYGWAEDTDRIEVNPTSKLPVVKAAQPRPRPALDHEYSAALGRAGDRETLALRLGAEMGLRRAEVASLHSRDITGTQSAWSLQVHGKGAKLRTLPLPNGLAEQLRALPEGYVFPGQINGHMSPRWMGKLVSGLLPAGVTMHALRHRFATRAYNIDRDVFTVQQLLGHASPATTQRYVQVSDERMRRLVEAANA